MGFLQRLNPFRRHAALPVNSRQYVDTFKNRLHARYDAARTNDDNERHWANADMLSASAAGSSAVRSRVCSRARYEAQENNSYAKGMILTLANDLIGTGPRLQTTVGSASENRQVEELFLRWAESISLAEKLRTMRIAKCVDGEAFALLTTREVEPGEVSLDIMPIEADRVQNPLDSLLPQEEAKGDGIRYDDSSRPVSYHILNTHPGDLSGEQVGGKWVSRSQVLHIYRVDRPEQKRGISEIVTALPLFAQLRRFTLATLAAAETAADFAAVLYTDAPGISGDTLGEDEWFDAIPIEYRAMLTLPNGWKMGQLKAEHPTTTYEMFKHEILNEIARCLNMPFNVASANSSGYNYASGRLDHQVYFKSIDVERHHWECEVLRRIVSAWWEEGRRIPDYFPEGVDEISQKKWRAMFHWDTHEHVDPSKVASADEKNLRSGIRNRKMILAERGVDLEEHDQAAAESYGVSLEEYRQRLFEAQFQSGAAPEPDVNDEDNPEDNSTDQKGQDQNEQTSQTATQASQSSRFAAGNSGQQYA